jgi:hypothetical protein
MEQSPVNGEPRLDGPKPIGQLRELPMNDAMERPSAVLILRAAAKPCPEAEMPASASQRQPGSARPWASPLIVELAARDREYWGRRDRCYRSQTQCRDNDDDPVETMDTKASRPPKSRMKFSIGPHPPLRLPRQQEHWTEDPWRSKKFQTFLVGVEEE